MGGSASYLASRLTRQQPISLTAMSRKESEGSASTSRSEGPSRERQLKRLTGASRAGGPAAAEEARWEGSAAATAPGRLQRGMKKGKKGLQSVKPIDSPLRSHQPKAKTPKGQGCRAGGRQKKP